LPDGITLRRETERSLDELLRTGEIDALISARAPDGVATGALRAVLAHPVALERAYWRETGAFPIMHLVVLRRDVLDRWPWLAASLYRALDEARRRCVARLLDATASHVPLPWVASQAEDARRAFSGELWPYGVEPNRATLDAFLRHAADQSVTAKPLLAEELFDALPDTTLV